jgi:lipoate-protein ligase B
VSPREVQWLGQLAYPWALQLQRTRRQAVIDGRAPEVLWLLEHPAVVTRGRRGGEVVGKPAWVPVHDVERGGLATVHVPGQLVGYLIVDLPRHGIGVREGVRRLEEGLIRWLATRGISAGRREGYPGVWVGEAKIAALGLHVRRGVTMHGFALNLDPDLRSFDWIVPCGIAGAQSTSVARCGGGQLLPHEVADEVGASVWHAVVDTPPGPR